MGNVFWLLCFVPRKFKKASRTHDTTVGKQTHHPKFLVILCVCEQRPNFLLFCVMCVNTSSHGNKDHGSELLQKFNSLVFLDA